VLAFVTSGGQNERKRSVKFKDVLRSPYVIASRLSELKLELQATRPNRDLDDNRALIDLDVEGSEPEVLIGAQRS
jgi:hypothetical protein